jgi:hypothetical protein
MVQIEQIAEAVLQGNSLAARSLAQDFLREQPDLAQLSKPNVSDERILAAAASLLELFAERRKQAPPTWTGEVGPLPESIFLLKAAATMKRLRYLCESESPEPLRKRGFYAPPDYLTFV